MSGPTADFKSKWEYLVQEQDEVAIRATLRELLYEAKLGRFKMEDDAGSGPADLKSRQYRSVIETKGKGKAGPTRSGSRKGETQRDQLKRYLEDAVLESQQYVFDFDDDNNDVPWRGFITDGINWWIYEAIPDGGMREFQEGHYVHCKSEIDLWNLFTKTIGPVSREGLPPPPDDLAESVFGPFVAKVRDLIQNIEGTPFYDTKFSVWKEVLRGAGIVPPVNQSSKRILLFAKHTTLVVAARILKLVLGDQNVSPKKAIEAVGNGFPAWLLQVLDGPELIAEMVRCLKEFDWRGETRDRLKEAYHGLIEAGERKEFGEYYTPDWLAKKVVEEVLDDTWMDDAIARAAAFVEGAGAEKFESIGLGVLDPACGSGTFLFHAARRLGTRIATAHPRLMPNARSILIRLVVGIDTHPIAVEMAKATFEMALPRNRSGENEVGEEPQIFLGDAMQSVHSGHKKLSVDVGKVETESPGGQTIPVPLALLLHSEADKLIDQLVSAANENRDIQFPQLTDISEDLKEVREILTRVIKRESNHVWGWYLRNMAGPIRVSENKVGRIVMNPPWLVANDTPEGNRKKNLADTRAAYGLAKHLRGSSAKGDLAATFAARIADLYLDFGGRMGLVLPGSALINQTWMPWRTGKWGPCNMILSKAWDLGDLDPPPFEHAPNGTSVVFGQRAENARPLVPETVGYWKGHYTDPDITVKKHIEKKASKYLNQVMRGALAEPHGLLYVDPNNAYPSRIHDGCRKITTKASTKGKWAGKSLSGTVEKEVLMPIVIPAGLQAFAIRADMFLIVPLTKDVSMRLPQRWILDLKDEEFHQALPHTRKFWTEANKIYVHGRSPNAGETLSKNLDYRRTLSSQFIWRAKETRKERRKVIYNKSGSALRAARAPIDLIVNGSLYYLVVDSEDEALYLCGILNADCMQKTWVASRTSQFDFHKSPWRAVPIPIFDASAHEHVAIVQAAREAETQITEVIRRKLDRAVAQLLPDYAETDQ